MRILVFRSKQFIYYGVSLNSLVSIEFARLITKCLIISVFYISMN